MNGTFSWKWAVLALMLAAALAAGCGKKQTLKSGVDAGAPPVGTAPGMGETPVTEAPITEAPLTEPPPPMMTAKEAEAARGVAVTVEKPSQFEDVLFDFDQSALREDGKRICQDVAAYMKGHPRSTLLIEGHCDERGTAEYNLALGDRRATAVKNYLVSLGVSKGALSTVSFGKERPLDPGHNEGAWARNRRAHFILK
jgi:peptidoglycan-associated lipoprotein